MSVKPFRCRMNIMIVNFDWVLFAYFDDHLRDMILTTISNTPVREPLNCANPVTFLLQCIGVNRVSRGFWLPENTQRSIQAEPL